MRVLLFALLATSTSSLQARSWQRRLDKALLDVDTTPKGRVKLLQRAFQDPGLAADLRKSVQTIQEKGFGKGHPEVIETLWPKGTIAREDIEGLVALRNQIPEAIKQFQSRGPSANDDAASSVAATGTPPNPNELLGSIVDLASDADKQRELSEELRNAFRSTPKGLETPSYRIVRRLEGPKLLGEPQPIEIREYEAFTVARMGSASGAKGFNTLAGYLFGGNEQQTSMAMTMPVEVTARVGADGELLAGGSGMAFVLPKEAAAAPPTPLTADVEIAQVEKRVVAVKAFPGIVTDEEVERQRQVLMQVLESQSEIEIVDATQVSTLQYNSPLTLPWRRRNEIAIVVTLPEPAEAPTARLDDEESAALKALEDEMAERRQALRLSFEERRRELLEANAAVPEPTPEPRASADAALEELAAATTEEEAVEVEAAEVIVENEDSTVTEGEL